MDDREKWIKICEHDLKCLQQEKPVSVDDLDLTKMTKYNPVTRKAIIDNVNVMNNIYNERVKIYKDMIKQLKKGEPL